MNNREKTCIIWGKCIIQTKREKHFGVYIYVFCVLIPNFRRIFKRTHYSNIQCLCIFSDIIRVTMIKTISWDDLFGPYHFSPNEQS